MAFFKISLFLGVVGTTALVPAQLEHPQVPYRVQYRYDAVDAKTGQRVKSGHFTLTETADALRLEDDDSTDVHLIDYSNHRTLTKTKSAQEPKPKPNEVSGKTHYGDGYAEGYDALQLYFPFDYANLKVFYPLKTYIDQLDSDHVTNSETVKELKAGLGDSNVALATNPGAAAQNFAAGRYAAKQGPGQTATLVVGSPATKASVCQFSDFHVKGAPTVPAKVEVLIYDFVGAGAKETTATTKYVYTLDSFQQGPSVTLEPKESLLSPGEWISFAGYDGKAAAVVFDPKSGSLDSQVGVQLEQIRDKPMRTTEVSKSSVVPIVSAVLAILFAIGAVVFFRRGQAKGLK